MAFINYLTGNHFTASIKRLPNTVFHLQRANIPSISGNAVPQPTALNPLRVQYDKVEYHELTMGVLVDEGLDNYMEIFEWMHHIGFPQHNSQFKNNNARDYELYSDITLHILNSNKNEIARVTFHDAFPTYLGDLFLDSTQPETAITVVDVIFNYNYYTIERN